MAGHPSGASTTVRVEHRTAYAFDPPVRLGRHTLRLRPADRSGVRALAHRLEVTVHPDAVAGGALARAPVAWRRSRDGEWHATLELRGRTDALTLTSTFDAAVGPIDPLPPDPTDTRAQAFDVASQAARRVQGALTHVEDHGSVVAPAHEVLARGTASCRDSAMVLVDELVRLGLRARFVAGYLIRLAGEEDLVAGPWPATVPAVEDVVAYHAWVEVRLGGGRWVGFDATTGRPAGGGHVPVASGPHPRDTLPVEGATERCRVTLTTTHVVRRT